jgi:alkanesulfonate monooxygenase SsuD/methylene tetrahydromethanopterin reductase-like flavin-dependent oxidoreductase (luciferase family)
MTPAEAAPSVAPTDLGIALGWHCLPFVALVEMARLAERLGFRALFVDGDVSQIPSRGEGDVLDGFAVLTALLAKTERIEIGSIRLVHHWNAAKLAQAIATLERIAPGRQRVTLAVGGQAADRRFGLAMPDGAARSRWLGETLGVVRRLLAGDDVSFEGEFVRVEGARVRPTPPAGRPRIFAAGRGPRLLEQVARHADGWDLNLPALPDRLERAQGRLERACEAVGRDPATIERSMWIFTRPDREDRRALAEEFRRWNPWYADVPDERVPEVVASGSPATCRAQLAAIRERAKLTLAVADLSGLDHDAVRHAIEVLAS